VERKREAERLGRQGERRAALHYLLRGYRIVERNLRDRDGEIDLVVKRGRLLVFVEVKTRSADSMGEGWESVDREKQLRIIRAAQRYLARQRLDDCQARFDVVSLVWTGWRFRLERFEDAFGLEFEEGRPWRLQ
jgi:putative endonuclease